MNAKVLWSTELEICSLHFPGARELFGLQRKVGRHVATLDLDFLCRRRSHGSRFAMIRLEGVSAVRHVLDGVFAIFITYCEVRMIHYAHVGEHPRMHVALEPQERFGAWEGEREVRTASHLRSVFFLVARCCRSGMNVMHYRIGVFHDQFLVRLDR